MLGTTVYLQIKFEVNISTQYKLMSYIIGFKTTQLFILGTKCLHTESIFSFNLVYAGIC